MITEGFASPKFKPQNLHRKVRLSAIPVIPALVKEAGGSLELFGLA